MSKKIYLADIELAQKSEVDSALLGKQDTLVSQQNIKSINGQSLLGEGNIQISSGDGVAVLEFGGYVDADTLESHLTLTKEEFLKGINNEVAFAKVELDTDEGGTLVKVIDLYLTKLTGEYVEGQNGQLMFSSSFSMGSGPHLATLNVAMDDSTTLASWDIDFDAVALGGEIDELGIIEIQSNGNSGTFTDEILAKIFSDKFSVIKKWFNNEGTISDYYIKVKKESFVATFVQVGCPNNVSSYNMDINRIDVNSRNKTWTLKTCDRPIGESCINSYTQAGGVYGSGLTLISNGSGGVSWQAVQVDYDNVNHKPIINQTAESGMGQFAIGQKVGNGFKVHFDTTKASELLDYLIGLGTGGHTFVHGDSSSFMFNISQRYYDSEYQIQLEFEQGGTYVYPIVYGSNSGFQNLDSDGNYTIVTSEEYTITQQWSNLSDDWNGYFFGPLEEVYDPVGVDGTIYHRSSALYKYTEKTSSTKPIQIGDTIASGTSLHFDTSNDSKLVEILTNLIGSDSRKCLIRLGMFAYSNGLGVENDGTAIKLVAYNSMSTTILFASANGSGYTQGWQNLDGNNDYTFTNIQSGQEDVQTLYDFIPFEWNGVFVGYNETTTTKKYDKFLTDGEGFEVIDFTALGNLDQYPITEETYKKLLNQDNIAIKFLYGSNINPFYAYKAKVEESNDGTNYWKCIYFISSYSSSGVGTGLIIDWNSSYGYYAYKQNIGSIPYAETNCDMWNATNYCQAIGSSGSGTYNIREATYEYGNALSSGDILDAQSSDYELASAIQNRYPVIVNGKRYEFQKKETNGSSQDVDTYMTSYINGSFIHISMFEYNESTYVITFKEQDVNSGVAYTTTPPSSDNLDGDLKFVVLTSTQAQGITKYNGYLYYII